MGEHKRWRAGPPKGWVPVKVVLDHAPPYLEWEELGSDSLHEPFLLQSLNRLRAERGGRRIVKTDLQALLESNKDGLSIAPAGVIFHVSRCGSTLVTNYLKGATPALVLSEPDPFMDLLRPGTILPLHLRPRVGLGELLNSLVVAFACCRSDRPERVVLKLSPLNNWAIRQARELWPNTSFAVLIRDPTDVVLSNCAKRAPWLRGRGKLSREGRSFAWVPASPHQMSDIEYCARAVGEFYDALASGLDNKCIVVDYSDIDTFILKGVATWFKLPLLSGAEEHARLVLSKYSKTLAGANWIGISTKCDRRFLAVAEASVQQWASPSYIRILASRGLPSACQAL